MYITKSGVIQKIDEDAWPSWRDEGWAIDQDRDGTPDSLSGGGSFPDSTGSGSPEGVVTADLGKSYIDTDTGVIYFNIDGATAWTGLNQNGIAALVKGIYLQGGNAALIAGAGDAFLSDLLAWNGSGNGLTYRATGVDGQQRLWIQLGPAGEHTTKFNADGTTELPGDAKFVAGAGSVHRAPNGSLHRTVVANDGTLSTVLVT